MPRTAKAQPAWTAVDCGNIAKVWLEVAGLAGALALAVVVLYKPQVIKTWCVSAEFVECKLFDNTITKTDGDKVQAVETSTGEIRAAIGKFETALAAIAAQVEKLPAAQRALLQPQIDNARAGTNTASNQLDANLATIGDVVDRVASSGSWAVVFGGHGDVGAARSQVKRAADAGVSSAVVFLRPYNRDKPTFRSVALFADRAAAQQALAALNTIAPHRDAYLVNLEKWCKGQTLIDDPAFGPVYRCAQ